jgi:hypothetical protein
MADGRWQMKISQRARYTKPYAFRLKLFSLMHQLVHKHSNAINQRGHKNTFGRFIPVGVDIDGEQNGISQERNAADGREQLQVCMQNIEIFAEADGPAENPKIINDHGDKGSEYTQEDTEF